MHMLAKDQAEAVNVGNVLEAAAVLAQNDATESKIRLLLQTDVSVCVVFVLRLCVCVCVCVCVFLLLKVGALRNNAGAHCQTL